MIRPAAVVAVSCLALAACATGGGSHGGNVSLPNAPRPGEPPGIDGLSAADMRANFGTPAFVRKDGKIEMWRYDTATCKTFFFLYPESNVMRVRHVETLPRGGTIAGDPVCLSLLLKRPAQPVS
jgi:hypothetical protein